MKRFAILAWLLYGCTATTLWAQKPQVISWGIGLAHYYGDLQEKDDWIQLRPSASIYAAWFFRPCWAIRTGLQYARLSGSDLNSTRSTRLLRQLHFRSHLVSVSAEGVWTWFKDPYRRRWRRKAHLSPFISGGIAVVAFNPQAKYQGAWYDLQPLGTEGQYLPGHAGPRPYSRIQIAIPVSLGLSIRLSRQWGVAVEWKYHKTFTDYLDDVSGTYADPEALAEKGGSLLRHLADPSGQLAQSGAPRGNARLKDSFSYSQIRISYYIRSR